LRASSTNPDSLVAQRLGDGLHDAVSITRRECEPPDRIRSDSGVRVIEPGRGWILVLPDPSEAVTHLWAEGSDGDSAQALLDEWAAVVARAGR